MRFGEATFRSYSSSFQPLNGKLTPHSHLRRLTGRGQVPFLTGFTGLSLNAAALMLPKTHVQLLQRETVVCSKCTMAISFLDRNG